MNATWPMDETLASGRKTDYTLSHNVNNGVLDENKTDSETAKKQDSRIRAQMKQKNLLASRQDFLCRYAQRRTAQARETPIHPAERRAGQLHNWQTGCNRRTGTARSAKTADTDVRMSGWRVRNNPQRTSVSDSARERLPPKWGGHATMPITRARDLTRRRRRVAERRLLACACRGKPEGGPQSGGTMAKSQAADCAASNGCCTRYFRTAFAGGCARGLNFENLFKACKTDDVSISTASIVSRREELMCSIVSNISSFGR